MSQSVPVAAAEQRSRRTTATIGYFAGFVALGLAYAVLGPTLIDLAANVGTDLTSISYVLSARGLGYLVGSLVGSAVDRRHPVGNALLVRVVAAGRFRLPPW